MGVASAPGTGIITLGSAASGFQSFSDAGVLNGDVISYVIEDGSAFEIGTGTYTASGLTLTRTPVQTSNGDGSAINASASATVYVTLLAQNAGISGPIKLDLSGTSGALPVSLPGPVSTVLQLASAAVSASNPLPVAVQGAVTLTGSPTVTLGNSTSAIGTVNLAFQSISGPATVPTPFNPLPTGLYFGGGNQNTFPTLVSSAAPLPATLFNNNSNPVWVTANALTGLAVNQFAGTPWNMIVQTGGAAVSNTNGFPVTIVGGSTGGGTGGGTTFNGVLANSTATIGTIQGITNPVAVTGSVGITGTVNTTLTGSSTVTVASSTGTVSSANPLPISQAGSQVFIESSATSLAASATLIGANRANPGNSMLFGAHIYNSSFGTPSVRIEASIDGTTFFTVRTSTPATANGTTGSHTSVVCDAIYPYYRAAYVNGGAAQTQNIQFITYYSQSSVEAPVVASITSLPNVTAISGPYYTETSTALAAGASVTTSARTTGNNTGSNQPYTSFTAMIYSDQAGVARIEVQDASGTWFPATNNVVVQGQMTLNAPAMGYNFRVVFTNGSTAQTTFNIRTGFSRQGSPI